MVRGGWREGLGVNQSLWLVEKLSCLLVDFTSATIQTMRANSTTMTAPSMQYDWRIARATITGTMTPVRTVASCSYLRSFEYLFIFDTFLSAEPNFSNFYKQFAPRAANQRKPPPLPPPLKPESPPPIEPKPPPPPLEVLELLLSSELTASPNESPSLSIDLIK